MIVAPIVQSASGICAGTCGTGASTKRRWAGKARDIAKDTARNAAGDQPSMIARRRHTRACARWSRARTRGVAESSGLAAARGGRRRRTSLRTTTDLNWALRRESGALFANQMSRAEPGHDSTRRVALAPLYAPEQHRADRTRGEGDAESEKRVQRLRVRRRLRKERLPDHQRGGGA